MDRVFEVRPWAGGWSVFVGAENMAVEPFRAPADAVIHAKELARHEPRGAHISVYDEQGTRISEFFYQKDERGSLDWDNSVRSMAASRPARRKPRSGM